MLNDAAIWKNLNSPRQLFLIAGPCVIENEKLCLQVAALLKKTCASLGIFYVFKASFDKANRTSAKSFRGPGLDDGLRVLAKVREKIGVPVLTDIHNESHAAVAGEGRRRDGRAGQVGGRTGRRLGMLVLHLRLCGETAAARERGHQDQPSDYSHPLALLAQNRTLIPPIKLRGAPA